ncbi:MAG TPA: DUF1326 domain-containing protein [Tepidisphaeraceae bacterium]|jgi:hypothetical protein
MRPALLLLGCGSVLMWLVAGGCASSDSAPQPVVANPDPTVTLVLDAAPDAKSSAEWDITLDNIEACSCPTFCQCYFNDRPALHESGKEGQPEHSIRFCRFNNAFRVEKGAYNGTSLNGLKFWMAGDLGNDFSAGQLDWAVLHFEPSASPQQREAALAIAHTIFAAKWNSFTVGPDAKIHWQKTADGAEAKLDGGKMAEVALKTTRGSDDKPVVLQNVKFWAAPRNSGFEIMTNETEAYRQGDHPFEFHHTNGFFTRIEMSSKDAKSPQASGDRHVAVACAAGACCAK